MRSSAINESVTPQANQAWLGVLAGFCASFVGIGMARFAYTPLLPAIIEAHWFAPSAAVYLGAANLAGYLAGALAGRPAAVRITATAALRSTMLLATLSFFACAYPLGFSWFFAWRFCSGLAGGVLMVLAAPTVLPHLLPHRRGLASGIIFMGVGAGIAASGTVVPLLLHEGLRQSWIGLGVISTAFTFVSWYCWPVGEATPANHRTIPDSSTLRALYAEYALNAAGLMPHMLFLVIFVARGLGEGLSAGAEYWVLFGLGALGGPILNGYLADRFGFALVLRIGFLVEAAAVLMPALSSGTVWLALSSVVIGAFTPGIVPLVLGRLHELLTHHPAAQKAAWSKATVSFAIFQAGSAYGLSYIFERTDNYQLLFVIGAAAMIVAFVIDLAFSQRRK